uniref:ANK_REP_REGION domain-containing protein n=1 Tax=Macrostomum lignano TaxID=282301 RepID=A0A1I8GQC4_9PLAT
MHDTELHQACDNGDSGAVERLLKSGADPDARNASGRTPLWVASQKGFVPAMEPLLDAGAQLDCAQSDGATPLFAAAQGGCDPAVAKLLEAGASSDLQRQDGSTPLLIAAQTGHARVVRCLLDAGADPNRQRNDGSSPLLMAAQYGQQRVLEMLLQAGADLHLPNIFGSAALFAACWWNHFTAIRRLLQVGADVNLKTNSKWTPLHKAAQKGYLELVSFLIESGALVNALDNVRSSPLHTAAENGHDEVVKFLIESNASINAQDSKGDTPLHRAAKKGNTGVIRVLLEAGADSSLENKSEELPICLAASHCTQMEAIELLLHASQPHSGHIEAAIAAACCYGLGNNALRLLKSVRVDAEVLRRIVPKSCASLAVQCLRRFDRSTSGNVAFGSTTPSNWRTSSESQFSTELFETLDGSGFNRVGALGQQAEAEILQQIVRHLKPDTCINVVGSFSEGWGSSLKCLNGQIDKDSDIDFTEILADKLHIKGRCQCESPDPQKIVEYKKGYVRYPVATANPSNPQFGTPQSPAMDYVNALRTCCYPDIEVLRPGRPTQIQPHLLKALTTELQTSLCHLVRAAPPDKEGEWLRLSTTFLERLMIRGFNTLQGQLFVILKFLIKRHLSKSVSGLKTYVAKTLMFRMIDETAEDEWRADNLLQLTRRALEILCDGLQHGGEHECLPHFFAPDAAVYLRSGHSKKRDVMKAIKSTLENLRQPLVQLMGQLVTTKNSKFMQFHPFTLVPVTYDLHSVCTDISLLHLYPVVWTLVRDLATDSKPPMQLISSIPDCALSVRESLRAMAQLKTGQQEAALYTLRAAAQHTVSKGVVKKQLTTLSDVTADVWQQMENSDSILRFCFRYDRRPDLKFLPRFVKDNFPLGMQIYGNRFYMNFSALLKCLCLELIPTDVKDESRRWFEETLGDQEADAADLLLALQYCTDADTLAGIVHRNSDVIASTPSMQSKLSDSMLRLPYLHESCMRRTLLGLAHQLRLEATAGKCRRRRRRSGRMRELPVAVRT